MRVTTSRLWILALSSLCASCVHEPSLSERGIIPGHPGNWHVFVGARPQQIPASALGVPVELRVPPGQLWLLVGEVTYPLVKDAGASEVQLLSPAVEAAVKDPGSTEEIGLGRHHEHMAHALGSDHVPGTWFTGSIPVTVLAAPPLRASLQGGMAVGKVSTQLHIELVARQSCSPATPEDLTVRADPCFLQPKDCDSAVVRKGAGPMALGPFQLDLAVSVGACAVAL